MTPTALASRIESVTVYRRGARVVRVADVTPGALPPQVRIGGLPLGLRDSTVRARVEPVEGNGAVPVAFDLRVALEVPQPDDALPPADDAELEAARLEVTRRERLVGQIEKELARLERLAVVGRPKGEKGQRPPASPVAARRALLTFRVERERALRGELRSARDEVDKAERRRAALEDRERRASRARQAREHELRKAVIVSLRGAEGGGSRSRLVLEYLVPGACWAPVYTVKLDDGMTGAALAARAVVAQNTGEDWAAVAMTLSTAEATAWTELPELASVRIGRAQPHVAKLGWRPPPSGVDELYRDWDRAFAGRISVTGAATVTAMTTTPVMTRRPEPAPPAEEEQDEFEETETLVDRRVSMPPPPPAPQSMPLSPPGYGGAPEGAAMQTLRVARPASRSAPGPVAAAAAGAAMVFAAPVAAAKALAKKRERSEAPARASHDTDAMTGMFDMEKEAAPEPEEAGGELRVGDELLRYGELRMPAASAARRGHLVPAERSAIYLELLVEQRVHVRFDVMGAVERARQRAAQVASRVPPGCQLAWSEAFDYAYPAAARVDVPSDGDFHSIPLADRRTGCEPRYVVVPRESTDVFRTASVENPLEAPLLPGPIDVYLRGDFLLTSRLELTAPRGRFTLGLGVEQAIKVARNTRYREETAGLMGGALLLHHDISVEIRNNLPRAAPIEVRERLPVTVENDDDVELKLGQVSPAWEEWKQDKDSPGEAELKGGRRWRVTVPAGGKQELRADYEVKISAKHELVGGNRREA
ncbi:MAG TPA: DUF4139 domain-containing protein [Kofleriaceae bacterium]